KETGPELTAGVYAATDFWWTLEDKYPLAKMFVDAFYKKYNYRPEGGANNAYMSFAIWARMVSEAGTFSPPAVLIQHYNARPSRSASATYLGAMQTHISVRRAKSSEAKSRATRRTRGSCGRPSPSFRSSR